MPDADVLPFRSRELAVQPERDAALALPQKLREKADLRLALIVRADKGLPVGVSDQTLRRWREAYKQGGVAALAPNYRGRPREEQPWEARALGYIQMPSRLNSGEIAFNLRRDGYEGVTPEQVRRYRRTLPSNLDITSPKKLGKHFYRLNETPYVVRDWGGVPVGYLYEMDGHTCDFYIEDPADGGYFRPELTLLWDVRSQYIVDFWLGRFENSMDLRWLLSKAFLQWDHVPRELHVDPGAAKAHTMRDPTVGYCAKLDVDIHFALPGNARGKGLTEGGFHLFGGRFSKTMPTYLHNRTDDALRLFAAKWKRNEFPRINIRQLYGMIKERFIEPTRTEPRKGLDGKSPAELWATLQKNPVLAPASVLCRPRDERVVQNGRLTLDKRRYQMPQPTRAQWEDKRVIVEYDEWDDTTVWAYDPAGRFLCECTLVHRQPGLPPSRVQQKMDDTLRGQLKRTALKDAANAARARLPLTLAGIADSIDQLGAAAAPAIQDAAETVLSSGTSFTTPALPAGTRKPRPVAPPSLAHLRAEAAADAAERGAEPDTADQRIARALALEARMAAGSPVDPEDARWLARYSASSEYHSRKAMLADCGDEPETD